jgi:ATPase subunit of ABC transporter with duplicated ATPase domains
MFSSSSPTASFSLTATGLGRSTADRTLFSGLQLTIGPHDRIGVIGPNGIGKSTLLRTLAGIDRPDAGKVVRQPVDLTVGYLAQLFDPDGGEPVRQLLARRVGVAEAEAALTAAADDLAAGRPGADDGYAEALARFLGLGGGDLEGRLAEVAADLGLPEAVLDQPADTLSGGQAARVGLAAVLLARHEVLLLDEPTNDLDFAGLSRLERAVSEHRGAVVVVSHDRTFLRNVVDEVLEVSEPDGRAVRYGGGWDAYLEERATQRRHAEEDHGTYQQQRRTLLARSQQQREWAAQGASKAKKRPIDNDKFVKHFKIVQTEKLAAKARATERALERLERVDKPWEGWQLRLSFAEAPRAGAVVARLEAATVRQGSFVLGPLDLEIGWGERVALIGPNGCGKSTLLRAMLGRLALVGGRRQIGPGVVLGELDQTRGAFDSPTQTLLDAFLERSGLRLGEARTLLAKFGLGPEHVRRLTGSLSPGERTRACLATFQAVGTNTLVLDEPTNHLDLPAIEQLEQALSNFEGTFIVVSHDRAFLDALAVSRTVDVGSLARTAHRSR